MAVLTIAEKLAIAEINEYMIANAIQKKGLWGGGINIELPTKIRVIRESIEYRYTLNPSDTTLEATSNYMLGLCLYVAQAKAITGNGGVIAGTTGNVGTPLPYQFIVDASTTFIIAGQSAKTITAFIGFNLIFVRGGVTQNTDDTTGSYYSWSKSTGGFICYPEAYEGEVFGLFPI